MICANGLYVAVITLVCAPVNANPHGRTVGRPGDFWKETSLIAKILPLSCIFLSFLNVRILPESIALYHSCQNAMVGPHSLVQYCSIISWPCFSHSDYFAVNLKWDHFITLSRVLMLLIFLQMVNLNWHYFHSICNCF